MKPWPPSGWSDAPAGIAEGAIEAIVESGGTGAWPAADAFGLAVSPSVVGLGMSKPNSHLFDKFCKSATVDSAVRLPKAVALVNPPVGNLVFACYTHFHRIG